jgi:hypothetical protein
MREAREASAEAADLSGPLRCHATGKQAPADLSDVLALVGVRVEEPVAGHVIRDTPARSSS